MVVRVFDANPRVVHPAFEPQVPDAESVPVLGVEITRGTVVEAGGQHPVVLTPELVPSSIQLPVTCEVVN